MLSTMVLVLERYLHYSLPGTMIFIETVQFERCYCALRDVTKISLSFATGVEENLSPISRGCHRNKCQIRRFTCFTWRHLSSLDMSSTDRKAVEFKFKFKFLHSSKYHPVQGGSRNIEQK